MARDGETALEPIERALERYPLEELDLLGRPYLDLAAAYALAAFEGRHYLYGGWDGESFVPSVFEYRPDDDEWVELEPMSSSRGHAGLASTGGRIHVFGGYDGEQVLTSHESFSPVEGTDPFSPSAPDCK